MPSRTETTRFQRGRAKPADCVRLATQEQFNHYLATQNIQKNSFSAMTFKDRLNLVDRFLSQRDSSAETKIENRRVSHPPNGGTRRDSKQPVGSTMGFGSFICNIQ